MLPSPLLLGVLFGLGFDTATEVGVLGIAALEAGKGLPIIYIMIFPALFLAGMCLLDTIEVRAAPRVPTSAEGK